MRNSRRIRGGAALLGVALLTGGLVAGPADAKTEGSAGTTNACQQQIGMTSYWDTGSVDWYTVIAGSHPAVSAGRTAANVYPPNTLKLSGSFTGLPSSVATVAHQGYVVLGSKMYISKWAAEKDGTVVPGSVQLVTVGGGWDRYKAFVNSAYKTRQTNYGLRDDGLLFRWTILNGRWTAVQSAGGFGSVKTMALLSQTATYDSFLAITGGGALYTIRVPLSSPMKPVVKPVRTSTWQAFDQLVITPCGKLGTLLFAIDRDLQVGYLYAVGHANGLATVMQPFGRVTGAVFPAQADFRFTSDLNPPLNGE
ncbi:hypothetical protein OHA70_21750 [Kribbella sp. NBC_00382]|uniref:hypothetical protein n=1 Tax=Kribbella sp. NBC_00382 TaxID=2975967 RepID=UPI002E1B3052